MSLRRNHHDLLTLAVILRAPVLLAAVLYAMFPGFRGLVQRWVYEALAWLKDFVHRWFWALAWLDKRVRNAF